MGSSPLTNKLSNLMRKRIAFRGPPYKWLYMLIHPWEITSWIWDEIRWFIQRGLYGYADCDWWGLNGYLLAWLPSALHKLAAGHSHPAGLTAEEWNNILEKIASGLDKGRDYLDNPWDYNGPPLEFNEAMALFDIWFWDLWD